MLKLGTQIARCSAAAMALGVALGAAASAQSIAPSPAFTPEQLLEPPREAWITNGGTLFNQRYSPLDQINRDNIGELKGEWRVSLNGSGMGPGFSQEAQSLYRDGVLYIVTGQDDVFAVDVETGDFRWVYEAGVELSLTNMCCGWISRGVGMGEGKIFVGRVDAKLVALDQTTGEEVWSVDVGDPARGHSITSAPLYYDGMVITGIAGGEYGVRGYVTAYDAGTGELVWRFYTVPGPGEFGHDTWPQDNDAWMYGGAPVWQTPSVDPELGLIYFSTGNPGPDLNGGVRAGDNLFSVSIVALDVATGEYRWHFQQVRHDIWDYDSPNPTILFDAEYDGVTRKGIAQASKSGYLYILDRTDGTPLTPIVDTPVPQEPSQATAATQPIPQGDPVVTHIIDAVGEDFVGLLPNWGRTFTPFSGDSPGNYIPGSGVNWQPSSYDPATNHMFLCATDSASGAFGGDLDGQVGVPPGQQYYGGGFGGPSGVDRPTRRLLVAMDLTDHSAVWRRNLNSRCSGSIATAGGLLFVGSGDGRFLAMNSDTGQKIWEFQTDGGVNGTATIFEHDGEQLVAVLAGGGLFGGKTNDGLWLFSLSGTMESLPPGSADVGPPSGPAVFAPPPAVPTNRVADLARGAEIYRTVCQACHGETGEGAHEVGAPLPGGLTIDSIMQTADTGRPGTNMQAFRGLYNAEEFHDVATYIHDVILAGRPQ
jgi:alcohol dehydrogenase (cytochrome c)